MLDRPHYLERSRQLADEIGHFISEPSGLLIGEGKPATRVSPRGCRPVAFGYNVEESLPAIASGNQTLAGGPHLASAGMKPCVHHTFTHAKALAAEVKHSDTDGRIHFEVTTRLLGESGEAPPKGKAECALAYLFDRETTTITASAPGVGSGAARPRLVLPIISPGSEKVTQVSAERIEIRKSGGTLILKANAPLQIQDSGRPRIFNLVPGFEAVPICAAIPIEESLICRIRVEK